VRRTTVEITVLLLINHVTKPNYYIVLTMYSIYSNEIVYWLDYLNSVLPLLATCRLKVVQSRPTGGTRCTERE